MAVYREPPKCPFCGVAIAEGVYREQSHIPSMERIYGDTFMFWKPIEHICEEGEKAKKQISDNLDKKIAEMKEKGNLPSFFK